MLAKIRPNQGFVGRENFDQPRDMQITELMWMLPSSMKSSDGKGRIDQSPRDLIGWLSDTGSSVYNWKWKPKYRSQPNVPMMEHMWSLSQKCACSKHCFLWKKQHATGFKKNVFLKYENIQVQCYMLTPLSSIPSYILLVKPKLTKILYIP